MEPFTITQPGLGLEPFTISVCHPCAGALARELAASLEVDPPRTSWHPGEAGCHGLGVTCTITLCVCNPTPTPAYAHEEVR